MNAFVDGLYVNIVKHDNTLKIMLIKAIISL